MNKESPPDEQAIRAAARLRNHKQRVLTLWERRVRQLLPAARQKDTLALRDSLPEVLEGLADLLSNPAGKSRVREQHEENSIKHGDQRAQLSDYSLDQVLREYLVLRQAIVEVLEEEHVVTAQVLGTVFDYVLLSLQNAVTEFSRRRDEEKEDARAALQQANETLEQRVTERVAELRFSEERFRRFVESVEDYAIFTLDPDGHITTWNVGCVRVEQYSVKEAVGQHYSILFPEEGRQRGEPMSHLRAALTEGRFRGEGVRVRKNGDLFLADVSITPIYRDHLLLGFTKVVQDLTERKWLMHDEI